MHRLGWLVCVGWFVFLASAVPGQDAVEPLVAEGVQLLQKQEAQEAAKRFEDAFQASGKSSADALAWEAVAWNQAGKTRRAEKTARQALELAASPEARVRASNALGLALMQDSKKTSQLEEAVAAFQQALEHSDGSYNTARFNLGEALLRLERDEEGVAMLQEYLAHDPPESVARRAKSLIEDPRRAREAIVPAYSIRTLDGHVLTDQDLRGRVVLLDFWATWCGPCLQALPDLERLQERMEGEPFVMVSISADRDQGVLEAFLAEEDLNGHQAWDGAQGLRSLFGVQSYPTYIVVGPEGRILYRDSGWGTRSASQLSGVVGRAVRQAKR